MRAEPTAPNILTKYSALANKRFVFRNTSFLVTKRDVTRPLLKSLGINPLLFRSGLKIYYFGNNSFDALLRLCGFDKTIEGMYPLAKKGEVADVFSGAIPRLPDSSRVICLPRNHNPRELAHEILHDIFMGGAISRQARDIFVSQVPKWREAAENSPARAAEARFYKNVSLSCASPDDPAIFAGEAFVYAAEYYLGYSAQREIGMIPKEILRFFEQIRLMA